MSIDPAALRIRSFPDPVLRGRAAPVGEVTEETRAVAARMIELMHEADGIGLAAPQVGLSWRLFVVHVPEGEGRSATASPQTATPQPIVCINPEVTPVKSELVGGSEGCLSLPDITCEVFRPAIARLSALDVTGKPFEITAEGLLARCFQHEFDHLNGVLIIDRMTLKSQLANKAVIRRMEQAGAGRRP